MGPSVLRSHSAGNLLRQPPVSFAARFGWFDMTFGVAGVNEFPIVGVSRGFLEL